MNAVLKYPGAKWALAEQIISRFPEHHSYLEPFFGSGAVLFRKPRSPIETVNDLDGEVVNLFRCIREDPERLAREVYFTPYSREVYEASYSAGADETSAARAARFLIRCNQGHGFRTNEIRVGWKKDVQGRERAYAARAWTELPETILQAAERLREVQIEHRPALEVIRRFHSSSVLIYADPPYVISSRSGGRKQYRCEMTDEDHLALLEVLNAHPGPVLLSGYDSPLYNRLLPGWHRETLYTTDQLSRRREESLWMNFDPAGQTRLF